MIGKENNYSKFFILLILVAAIIISSCNDDDNELTSYAGAPQMSSVKIEAGTFIPSITWVGGFASVVGVNHGLKASLDSTLIWLVKTEGNNLRYPILFGSAPTGAVDFTEQYGGQPVDSLSEDQIYTYWVMKEEMWNQVSGITGVQMQANDQFDEGEFIQESDTLIELSAYSFTAKAQQIDVYVNVADLKFFGKLGEIYVSQPVDATGPTITWKIIQSDVTDTVISAIGIVEGQAYDEKHIFWDLWSLEESGGEKVYGKKNVISAPLKLGDSPDGTITFNQVPETGLERDKDYYIWIANENWEGNRFRVTKFYAYATFRTW